MDNLLWLGDPKSFGATLVGGKAANLSRLARLYHRVPDGFCLPVTVMDEAHPLSRSRWKRRWGKQWTWSALTQAGNSTCFSAGPSPR